MTGPNIQIDVALTPRLQVRTAPPPIGIVVDVLRATSTLTTLFELGARSVEIAADLGQARALAAAGRLVCAEERSGRQAAVATVPVSPSRLQPSELAGQDLVVCTTNGTRALRRVRRSTAHVVLGCLLNASAVAEVTLDLALRMSTSISVVCAGRRLGAIPCLDDTYAAGVIVERLLSAAAKAGVGGVCTDAAVLATMAATIAGSPLEALSASATGEILRRAGAEQDIAFCARVDKTDVVPVVVSGGAEARCPVVLL